MPGRDRVTSSHPTPTGQVSLHAWHAMYRLLSRVQSGGDAVYLLAVARRITCKDARLFDACSRLWRPPATCDKQRAMAQAWLGSTDVSTSVALRQHVQQCLGLLQVCGIKPFGEPMVDWCQEVMGFLAFAPLLPQACQAHGGAQLQRFGLLTAGDV